jgi:hypothetical protein
MVSLPDAAAGGAPGQRDFYFEEFIPIEFFAADFLQMSADKNQSQFWPRISRMNTNQIRFAFFALIRG